MRLLLLGDISVDGSSQLLTAPSLLQETDMVLANLEGVLLTEAKASSVALDFPRAVYNHPNVFRLLQACNVKAVWLANNHLYDIPSSVEHTKLLLAKYGITGFGAGENLKAASQPFTLESQQTILRVFAFGWDVIGCHYATMRREGVNPLRPGHLFQTIKKFRQQDKRSCVIFVFHWNYELELFPHPAHRQLGHDLIDAGVDAIVGLHPHVAQGAEIYKGKPIVYSLGNWFFPERQLGSIKLSFPSSTSRQLALELSVVRRDIVTTFHWYQFDLGDYSLTAEAVEGWDGSILKGLTPFVGMNHRDYHAWFRENRARRRSLPIYYDYRHKWRNWLKDQQVKLRQRLIRVLLYLGLKRSLSHSIPDSSRQEQIT